MCFQLCVPYNGLFLIPRREEGPETISICVFNGSPEAFRALHRAGYSI